MLVDNDGIGVGEDIGVMGGIEVKVGMVIGVATDVGVLVTVE